MNDAFVRFEEPADGILHLVVPESAQATPDALSMFGDFVREPASKLPNGPVRYYHGKAPPDPAFFADGATTDDGIWRFAVRDAVLSTFELAAFQHDELLWSLASDAILHVLVALRIGETLTVQFPQGLEDISVTHVMRFHFPSGVPDSGYGTFPFAFSIETRPGSLSVVSSFRPGGPTTASRLPFFIGLKVFGLRRNGSSWPVWRSLLAEGIRAARTSGWGAGLLQIGFALEAFIDEVLSQKLVTGGLSEPYISHVLRVGEKRHEIAEILPEGDPKQKRYDLLNASVFAPRNALAHGKKNSNAITMKQFTDALRAAVAFIWDVDPGSRSLLAPITYANRFEDMIDEDLIKSCATRP